MAVSEKNMLLTGKDSAGNKVLLYPVTKLECVDGADELLSFTERQELTDEQKQIALQNLGITGGVTGGGDNSGNSGGGSSCNCPTGTVNAPHTITWDTSVTPTVTFDIAAFGYTAHKISDTIPSREQLMSATLSLSSQDGASQHDLTLSDNDIMAESDLAIILALTSEPYFIYGIAYTAGDIPISFAGYDVILQVPESGIYQLWDMGVVLPSTMSGSMTYLAEQEVNFVQADWNQNDSTKPDYIKNKPNNIGGGSGSSLPTVSSADAGKFLRVSTDGLWVAETIPNAEEASF